MFSQHLLRHRASFATKHQNGMK